MELYGVGAEVLKATECHCKGQKYRPPKQLTTPAVRLLCNPVPATVDLGVQYLWLNDF
jgi:hypothetical protein